MRATRRAIKAIGISQPVESSLTRQVSELTTWLNSLDPAELQPQELAAINELIEHTAAKLDFDAKRHEL